MARVAAALAVLPKPSANTPLSGQYGDQGDVAGAGVAIGPGQRAISLEILPSVAGTDVTRAGRA